MEALLDAWKPDVAHVHAPSRYLTPSVMRVLERRGVPMAMTLHDFKPWCTNRVMFARDAPCLRCRGGAHWHAAAVACVQDSRARSVIGAIEAYVHDARGAYRGIRRWIAPSQFVRDRAVALGLDPSRITVIPHGIEPAAAQAAPSSPAPPVEPYLLYAGRLSVEKGVNLLPAIAARVAPAPIVIAGDGPLRASLEREAARVPNLRLVGHLAQPDLSRLLCGARAAIVPSLSEETFCFAAAEALLAGRPVVAARLGAIPELVEHEVTGLLAAPGEPQALALAVRRALDDPAACDRWGAAGRERVRARTAPEQFVRALLRVLETAAVR
jgi:glycosyltransferase involved in cell wall biosynthesis